MYQSFGSPYNEMTQTSSAIIAAIESLIGTCQVAHEYAFGQRPLFGNAGRLLRFEPQETQLLVRYRMKRYCSHDPPKRQVTLTVSWEPSPRPSGRGSIAAR